MNLARISVTGPESTGKSYLAEQLADYYTTIWVPEVAREFLANLNRPYGYDDIVIISREQLALENKLSDNGSRYLFCDTDFLVTKIWSQFKYGKCDPWIDEMVISHRYHLYLLCNIDLPWEHDPLREHPDRREELFGMYLKELQNLRVNYRIISGIGDERLKNAISAMEEAFR